MQNKRLEKRMKIVTAMLLSVVMLFSYYLTSNTGIIPGANDTVDKDINKIKIAEEAKITVEGSILDRDGENITIVEGKGLVSECLFPEAYAPLIGYESLIYGSTGIRGKYHTELTTGGKDGIGANIQFTTDNNLQQLAYGLIGDNVGSIVLMDNATGQILAMASRSDSSIEYDVNKIDENWTQYSSIDSFFANRAIYAQDPPGSTFKIITTAALIESEHEDYEFVDSGEYKGIHNAGGAAYGPLDLQTALIKSSNTYFASAGDMIGGSKLEAITRRFLIGESIDLDFGTISSNVDFDYYRNSITAQTAFGQGKTIISPLHIALVLQSVINNGVMMKPYVIQSINDDGKITYEGKTSVLAMTIDEETAKKTKSYLHETAVKYGFDEATYGIIFAKTGTAQVASGNYNHTYLVFGDDSYTGIISMDRSYNSSSSLAEMAKELIQSAHNSIE